jgi:hypothetical protein
MLSTVHSQRSLPYRRASIVVNNHAHCACSESLLLYYRLRVDATAVDHHDHLFPSGAKAGHDLMDILPKPFRIKLGDHFIKDVRRPLRDSTNDAAPHAAGHAPPTPIADPRLPLAGLCAFALAGAQRPRRPAIPRGCAVPPACPGEGETPDKGCICIQQHARAAPRALCQRGQGERRPRPLRGSGTEPARGPGVAAGFFF